MVEKEREREINEAKGSVCRLDLGCRFHEKRYARGNRINSAVVHPPNSSLQQQPYGTGPPVQSPRKMNQMSIVSLCLAALMASSMANPLPQGVGGVAGVGVSSPSAGGVSAVAGVSASGVSAPVPLGNFRPAPTRGSVGGPVDAGIPAGAPIVQSGAPIGSPVGFGPGAPEEVGGPLISDGPVVGGPVGAPVGAPVDSLSHAVNQAGVSIAQAITDTISVALGHAVHQATSSLAGASATFVH